MIDHSKHDYTKLPNLIDNLKPHDHLCLIYESREEWLETVVPFISSGLKRGEKCIYVVDANTAQEVKAIYEETGMAVDEYESKGQFSIIHERDTYTREGFFDPDLMIDLLIEETEQALREGYPALRVTGEMSWALRNYSGAEKILEYEAKLNKEFFPKYPCVAICQYDRWKFEPETIKGVVLTHPLLIRGGYIYRNFYYIKPDEYLNHKKGEIEVQRWLNNLERERKTQESLRESEEKHRRLFETMTQGVIYQAADGRIISANPSAEKILGLSLDKMKGKTSMDPHWQMIKEDGKAMPGTDHPAMIALRTGRTVGPVTRGIYRPDLNKHIWLNITAIPLFQQGGNKPFQAYAIFEDITKRKQAEEEIHKLNEELEQRVKERTIQLEAVNEELQSFAYSISHDFRAPLRALDAFSAGLNETYGDQLDEKGRHYLSRIRNAAIYMSDLIDALLKLSRIARTVVKRQEVDISRLAGELIQLLQETEPERRVEVKIDSGLTARGDRILLRAALENLLGNAWKFSSREKEARIEVGRTVIEGTDVFFIRDNGAGFNMAYADKLFGAFQRLHGVDEFPGAGIGLATVQRVINLHGGKVWAESEVGRGATFYFTLGP